MWKILNDYKEIKFENDKISPIEVLTNLIKNMLTGDLYYSISYTRKLLNSKITFKNS